ncbi:MAG: hypothetical protein AB7S69_13045 [Salinivirgaceae bacterium]
MEIRLKTDRIIIQTIRSIIFPTILYVLILWIYTTIGRISLTDILEFKEAFFIPFIVIIGISIIFLFEYLLFSLNKRFIINKKNLQFYKHGYLYKSINLDDIKKVIEYGETYKFHFFPWGSYKYADFLLQDDSRITINNLQYKEIKQLFLDRYEFRRNIFPSLILYRIYIFFAERD